MTAQHDSTSPVELEAAPMGHQQMQQMQQGQRPMAPAANPPKKQQVPHLVPHYYCDPYGELSGDAMLSCRTRGDGALSGRDRAGEGGLQRGHQVRQHDQGPLHPGPRPRRVWSFPGRSPTNERLVSPVQALDKMSSVGNRVAHLAAALTRSGRGGAGRGRVQAVPRDPADVLEGAEEHLRGPSRAAIGGQLSLRRPGEHPAGRSTVAQPRELTRLPA